MARDLATMSPTERLADPRWAKRYGLMLEGDLAFYCSEILRGPPEYGGQFLLGPHHVRWSRIIREEDRILALAARDHGKCVAAGTPVLMADGTSKPIEYIQAGEWVQSWTRDGYQPRLVEGQMQSGEKLIYRLVTSTGRQVLATEDHKFLQATGNEFQWTNWVRLGDLQEGDWVVGTGDAPRRRNQVSRVYRDTPGGVAVQVVKIEPVGPTETYDLQIQGSHNYVCDHLVVHNSHFFCFGYPLWRVDRASPGRIGYIFSATEQQAYDHLEKVVMEITGGGENGGPNPKLQHLLEGRDATTGKKTTMRVSRSRVLFPNGSQIKARGFGTNVRGGHPFWAVADDVGQDEWIYSDIVRDKAIDYFLSAIRPMVIPGGQLIVVGTPFHALDLYNTLEKTGVYRVLKDPAISKAGEILWPARYDAARLETTRKELANELRFAREYLCEPISDAASLFPGYLFDAPGVKQPYALGLPGSVWADRGATVYAGVDLALSSSAAADYFCFFVLALMPDGTRYIVDIVRRKGLAFQEQLDLIKILAKKYDVAMIYCEANQYQRVVTDEVVRTSDTPIKAFYTTGKRKVTSQRMGMTQTYSAAKNAFDQGVPALRMLFENGKIRIPYAPESRDTVDTWIEEMRSFGWADGKLQGVGAHDDTVMALWIADHACRTGGISFAFGDDDADMDGVDDWNSWEDGDEGEFDPLGVLESEDWKPKEGVGINDPFIR